MTIEVEPGVESAIQQRMATGAFRDVNELLRQALDALKQPADSKANTAGQALIDAFAPVRGLLTDEEVDTLFARDRSPMREIEWG